MNTSSDPILQFGSNNNVNYDSCHNVNRQTTSSSRLPVRYIMAAVVLLATFTTYNCRFNLSIAIVEMSMYNDSESSNHGNGSSSDVCVTVDSSVKTNEGKVGNGEFDWDQQTQGVILGAFFYGYVAFQVLGGRLAELFGAKWLCAVSLAMSAVINALTPLIARANMYWLFITSRVVLGAFQSVLFPACYALIAKWTPEHERRYAMILCELILIVITYV
jgi:MFS family permease